MIRSLSHLALPMGSQASPSRRMVQEAARMSTEFEHVSCATCGADFGIGPLMKLFLRQSEITFYCPFGHGLKFNRNAPAKHSKTPERRGSADIVQLRLVPPDSAA